MISGFAIILDEEILYISNEHKHPLFEIVLFVEKLISSLNPKNYWRLKNIYFKGKESKERMVIKHIVSENDQNLFYCIAGSFLSNSEEIFKLLDEYQEKVSLNYESIGKLKEGSKKSEFKKIIKLITGYLWDKYRDPLEDEEINKQCNNLTNKIIYCGISNQGLPIISQLYDTTLLNNFEKEITEENIDLFSSNISAKLATIAMNTQIRAKSSIKEIQFDDMADNGCRKIIIYSEINNYSLDFIASGDFIRLKEIFSLLEKRLAQEEILQKEFDGDLKPFKSLKFHLDDIIHEFDQ